MAHSCPDCGLLCYCGGDIDDCEFDGTPEQAKCKHCDGRRDGEADSEATSDQEAETPNDPS
jgi:hypothetical protein